MESRGDVPFHRTLRFKLMIAIIGSLGILSLFLIQYGYSVARDALVDGTIQDLKQSTRLATNELESTLALYERGTIDRSDAMEIIARNLAGEIRQVRIRIDPADTELLTKAFPQIFRSGELNWVEPQFSELEPSDFPGVGEEMWWDFPALEGGLRDIEELLLPVGVAVGPSSS